MSGNQKLMFEFTSSWLELEHKLKEILSDTSELHLFDGIVKEFHSQIYDGPLLDQALYLLYAKSLPHLNDFKSFNFIRHPNLTEFINHFQHYSLFISESVYRQSSYYIGSVQLSYLDLIPVYIKNSMVVFEFYNKEF